MPGPRVQSVVVGFSGLQQVRPDGRRRQGVPELLDDTLLDRHPGPRDLLEVSGRLPRLVCQALRRSLVFREAIAPFPRVQVAPAALTFVVVHFRFPPFQSSARLLSVQPA